MSIFEQVRGGTTGNLVDANLAVENRPKTKGYHSPDEGGGADYVIKSPTDPTLPVVIDEISYITIANGNIAQLIVTEPLKPPQWGLKKSDIDEVGFDNSSNLQALVDYASTTGSVINFETGRYYLASGITIPSVNDGTGINAVIFQGAGRTRTELFTDQDINMITHVDYFSMRDLFLAQRGEDGVTKFTGSGLYSAGQVRFCTFTNVNVWWFKFGTIWRFSLWCKFTNMAYNGNLCGIKLARNDDIEDQDNPSPPGFWNQSNGWFHNTNTFDTITFNGDQESAGGRGEIGFWGAVENNVFINITAQNYERDGTIPNQTIPLGQVSTCVQIEGGGATSSTSKGNSITGLYMERSFKGLKVANVDVLNINQWFTQGQAGGENLLECDDSAITVNGQINQSAGWSADIVATDSTVTFDAPLQSSGGSGGRSLTNSFFSETGVRMNPTIKTTSVTMSPGTGGGTITIDTANDLLGYSRLGQQVTVTGRVDVDSVSGATGIFFNIDGLPFSTANISERAGNAAASVTHFTSGGTATNPPAIIVESSTSLRVYMDASTVAAGDQIYLSASYLTDDFS